MRVPSIGVRMYDRRDIRQRKMLYSMARAVSTFVPEISDADACRTVLRAHGFRDDAISEYLRHVQHMARVIRGRDADHLAKKLEDQS